LFANGFGRGADLILGKCSAQREIGRCHIALKKGAVGVAAALPGRNAPAAEAVHVAATVNPVVRRQISPQIAVALPAKSRPELTERQGEIVIWFRP
jgi:hypothetical protein